MSISDIIQILVVLAAVAAVVTTLYMSNKQIRSSEKLVKMQIDASSKQVKKQIEASDLQVRKQIEESRRLASEDRQYQSRPILAPEKEAFENAITYLSMTGGSPDAPLYASNGIINWACQHEVGIHIHNMGNGPAFNIQALLYGPDNLFQSQFVSWDNGPIEEKGRMIIHLQHPQELHLLPTDSINGKYPLYDQALDSLTDPVINRIACLTLTYHDLFGKKHVSIFRYTITHQWIHVTTEEISGGQPLDLKELNLQKKQQSQKLSAPPVQRA